MQLIFATNNAHKVSEVRAILDGTGVSVVTLAEAGLDVDPPETGDTFEDNALQKARFVHALTQGWVVADDSGIEVDALGGRPGVHSKRFSPEATTDANNRLLLAELEGTEGRTARFRCVLALVGPGHEATVSGSCEGRIAHAPRGADGFGYDPLFLPDETPGRTMAELSSAEKNAISHRGRCFGRLPELLP
ncbi:MAG: RdgB/HAM1 family non-canonical purine NTP pyrophosphatase [Alphaproteobacteria bacterium]|nr:RdgB/HAM1 family non-canonical purine NTP pyrophosphatase [Alphaproteobacteria bacterium]